MRTYALITFLFLTFVLADVSIAQVTPIDSAMVANIRKEGMENSRVMDLLWNLTDLYGPRLTGSPMYKKAASWARAELEKNGLDARVEGWGPLWKAWELKRFSIHMSEPQSTPLIAYPKAWSPGTRGLVSGEVIIYDAKTDSALALFNGSLKGKFLLMDTVRSLKAHFDPEASRQEDSTLLNLANADVPGQRRRRFEMSPEQKKRALVNYQKILLAQKEGAAMLINIGSGDGGNLFVSGASVPNHPDTSAASRISAYDPKAPKILPQITMSAEHYNRLYRLAKRGIPVKLEANLDVRMTDVDSGYNVIAEIPGSDLKDEVVMIGAHFDSWHGGTGTTDNGTGSAVCMEAMRILKAIDAKPRRTIRIGLWGGEEQGLIGSEKYVEKYLGEREPSTTDQPGALKLKPAAEKFSVYFNNDNGTGRVRGVYMQGNEAARPIFRSWMAPFKDLGVSTLTLSNTGGTDHLSFDAIGLPGFQFIQDEIEYSTRTHHSTMDLYDRAQESDLKQAAVIMATFAYNAAMMNDAFPRKVTPLPQTAQGSH